MIRSDPRRIVVALARQRPRRGIVAEPHAGRRDRGHGGAHARAVHLLERTRRRPLDQRMLAGLAGLDLGDERRRRVMMMDVDPERLG